jgi:hypothetical protein
MLRDNPAMHDCSLGNSRKRVILELHSCIQSVMRIALAAGLLACFALPGFCASPPTVPPALTVKRSTRVFPHRFIVHPDGATVAANQTQRFEVTDAQGKTVAVHWNISGLTCSGLACGTIDSDGVYRTPSALQHPELVILEGVLDSNPNYSVLTQIALVPVVATSGSPAGSPAPAQVSAAKTQPMPSVTEQQKLTLARNTAAPPLPKAIAAAPEVERQITARAAVSSQPQPDVTRPLPVIEASNVAPEHSLPPLPTAVAAAPNVDTQIGRASASPPTQNVTAPPPAIDREHVAAGRSYSSSVTPLQAPAVTAAPDPEKHITVMARLSATPQLPTATSPAAVVEAKSLSAHQSLTSLSSSTLPSSTAPSSVASAPAAAKSPTSAKSQASSKTQTISLDSLAPPASVMVKVPTNTGPNNARPASAGLVNAGKTDPAGISSPPQPKTSPATPAVETQTVARATAPPLSNVTAPPAPIEGKPVATSHVLPQNTVATAPTVKKQTIAYNTPVLPLRSPAAVASGPIAGQMSTAKTQQVAPPAAGNDASRGVLLPLPDETATASANPPAASSEPIVTYRDGQLTIDAQNSTLAEVLKLVAQKSGAKIEVPPGSGLDRIFEHAGPGPAQDVLVSLLNGSPYDFVIVSSPQTPNTPTQVLLTLRGAEPAPAPAASEPVISAAAQPRPASGDPYLWTPPSSPQLYSGDPNPVIPRPPAVAPPTEPIPPDVLEQKLKEFNRQLRGGPPPSQ